MYKVIIYSLNGKVFYTQKADKLEWFDVYKNKKNYRIKILKGKKVIYSEGV